MANKFKTNVMRLLDGAKINYKDYCYAELGVLSGTEVAAALGQDPEKVFKTLVTVGFNKAHYVFVVPVERELDLKKSRQSGGREKHRYGKVQRAFAAHGLYPRRLLAHWHEKIFPHGYRYFRKGQGYDLFQRGQGGVSGGGRPRRP